MSVTNTARSAGSPGTMRAPRFGGLFLRLSRTTGALAMPFAGKRWSPVFAVVEHRGRRSGRAYATPVAARRIDGGFVISLAFGSDVDWHRNLVAAGGGTIRWRGSSRLVGPPRPIPVDEALPAFNVVQRAAMRVAGIDGYIALDDVVALGA